MQIKINKSILAAVVSFFIAFSCNAKENSIVDKVNNAAVDAVETVSEAAITTKVKTLFALEQDIPSFKIKVITKDHIVRLIGNVDTPEQVHRVVELAQGVKGVQDVDDTGLSVTDSNNYLQDAMLTARVKGRILQLAEEGKIAKGYVLNVTTVNNQVYIKGQVGKKQDIAQIENVARKTKNVKAAHTQINVAKR